MRYALLALTLALPFATGCRDALVDPPAGPVAGPGAVRTMYFKGPPIIHLGETVGYRGEPFPGATYAWTAEGDASFTTPDASSSRTFRLLGRQTGRLTLSITALVDGVPYAQAERVVFVVP